MAYPSDSVLICAGMLSTAADFRIFSVLADTPTSSLTIRRGSLSGICGLSSTVVYNRSY